MKRISYLVVIWVLSSLFSLSLTVQAQDNIPALAAVQNDNLVILGGSTPITVDNTPNKGFLSLAWNPGGTKLAYIFTDAEFNAHIAVTDAVGSAPVVLDTGKLESGFPVNWTPDGQVLFVGSGDFSDTSKPYTVDIKRIAPEVGATAETIGSFEMGTGCGGGSPLPSDWAYWEDTGFGGNSLILQWTDYGILHSSNCGGGGLTLFAPQGGENTPLMNDNYLQPTPDQPQQAVGRAVLAADGKTLAAVRSTYNDAGPVNSLVLIDLSTRTVTDVKTVVAPDQLMWLADGSLFYSARTKTGNLMTAITDATQKQNVATALGSSDFEMPSYEVSIHHLNLSSGEDKVIYTADAYAIGRMAVTSDGQALVFSQIGNLGDWLKAIADGTVNMQTDNDGAAQRALVSWNLYRLPLGGGDPVVVGDHLAQFRLKP